MDYSKKTVTELRKIAERRGKDGYFTRRWKAALIAKIDAHTRECCDDECRCKNPCLDRQQGPCEIIVVRRRRNGNSLPCGVSLIDNAIIVVNCQCNGDSCLSDAGA